MSKLNVSALVKSLQVGLRKHTPEILTGIGIAGMVTTTVMAVKATPKALALIDEAKKETSTDKLTPTKTVKATYKCYIPALITGTASIACLIGANSVNARRNAALAAAYTLSESTLKEYQEKVIDTIGEKKEQDIQDAIAKDKVSQNQITTQEIILTERGNTLCYDAVANRPFRSDREKINQAINRLNVRLREEMFISWNEFCYELGIPGLGEGVGDSLGWNIDREGYIEPYFSSQLTEDGTPCLVISYQVGPRYDYING